MTRAISSLRGDQISNLTEAELESLLRRPAHGIELAGGVLQLEQLRRPARLPDARLGLDDLAIARRQAHHVALKAPEEALVGIAIAQGPSF